MKEQAASHTARSVAARRLEYDRVAAPYGHPAADQRRGGGPAPTAQPDARVHPGEDRLLRPAGDPPPLFAGLEPYPDGWRAQLPSPAVLPHYPMTLHRGGYPDGS